MYVRIVLKPQKKQFSSLIWLAIFQHYVAQESLSTHEEKLSTFYVSKSILQFEFHGRFFIVLGNNKLQLKLTFDNARREREMNPMILLSSYKTVLKSSLVLLKDCYALMGFWEKWTTG